MDRRREPRLRVEYTVRIWGIDRMARPFAEVVRVKNVSVSGAELLGVHAKICAGGLLDVLHGSQRAQFRIVWAGSGEAGIEALPFEPCIWDVALPKTFDMVGAG
ncbi:MAG: hypothetical protein WA172_05065 [Terriglobales bacterium]